MTMLWTPEQAEQANHEAVMAEEYAVAELAQRKFRRFVEPSWPHIRPGEQFLGNWHIDAIAEHLQAVSDGEITNLVINMPPRCMKSILVSVLWPAWEWILDPWLRYLYASYKADLAYRDSVDMRRLIKTAWYQRHWGGAFKLVGDQDAKQRFDNDKGGVRIATGSGGQTGEGGHRLIADDPNDVDKVESDVIRKGVLDWWNGTMTTRGNQAWAARIVVQQRTHVEDVTGDILRQMGEGGRRFEFLVLPMRYDPKIWVDLKIPPVTSLGFEDPRETVGELLFPTKMPESEVNAQAMQLGPYRAIGQFQQRPTPPSGGMFKRFWWKRYSLSAMIHAGLRGAHIYVDSSYGGDEDSGNDPSCAAVWGEFEGRFYLMDLWRAVAENPDVRRVLRDLYAKWRIPLKIENAANGKILLQDLRRGTNFTDPIYPAIPAIEFETEGLNKLQRAAGVQGIAAAGLCYLPEGAEWAHDWIEEHAAFPKGLHDDQVDTTSMALSDLSKRLSLIGGVYGQTAGMPYGMGDEDDDGYPMLEAS